MSVPGALSHQHISLHVQGAPMSCRLADEPGHQMTHNPGRPSTFAPFVLCNWSSLFYPHPARSSSSATTPGRLFQPSGAEGLLVGPYTPSLRGHGSFPLPSPALCPLVHDLHQHEAQWVHGYAHTHGHVHTRTRIQHCSAAWLRA